ncbi:MAG: hypothetical protein H6739_33050 [Alphaproteobacteria bacterium]|nr:hypothetical protein [Alphaproteobacteria bacterium]
MRSALLLLCVAALSGCLSRESRHAEKLEGRYQLGDPGDGWRPVQPGGADFAFLNRDLGATMYADSNCGSRFEDAPLPDMVKHQLFGVVDPKAAPLHEAWTTLDGREAYTTRRAGILDGVAVELGVTVLKKDTCVYDLVVIASPGERFEQAWAGYQSMVQGFRTLP